MAHRYLIEFQGATSVPLRIVTRAPAGDALDRFWVNLRRFFDEYDEPLFWGLDHFHGGYALIEGRQPRGLYELLVVAEHDGEIDAPLQYEIQLTDRPPCQVLDDPPDYMEADESDADHRANDVVAIDVEQDPIYWFTEREDAPEETEITLEVGERILIGGHSADVPSDGDAHWDRDTFLFEVGDDVNEVDFHMTGVSLNHFVWMEIFEEGQIQRSLAFGGNGDQFTARVPPGENIWLWVGASTFTPPPTPGGYRITACPRTFTP